MTDEFHEHLLAQVDAAIAKRREMQTHRSWRPHHAAQPVQVDCTPRLGIPDFLLSGAGPDGPDRCVYPWSALDSVRAVLDRRGWRTSSRVSNAGFWLLVWPDNNG